MTAQEILKTYAAQYTEPETLYFDYRDKISPDHLLKLFREYQEYCNKGANDETFKGFLSLRIWEDWELSDREYDTIEELFKERVSAEDWDIVEEYLSENGLNLATELFDLGYPSFDFNVDDVIGKYECNFFLATPSELNLDMSAIPQMDEGFLMQTFLEPQTEDWDPEEIKSITNNALTYILYNQGYTLRELAGAYKNTENAFLKSVVQELSNFTFSIGGIVILASINAKTLDVLDVIAKQKGRLEFKKNSYIGLFDDWNGAGSIMEIELDKNVTVPAKLVYQIQIEDAKNGSHTVKDVYDLVGACWKPNVWMVSE